jgi:muramoyltetrapeptide carboxypeptidase
MLQYEGRVPLLKPPALSPGDVVRLIAPAGPFERDAFEAGLRVLSMRYQARFDEGLFARHRYLAGDDAHRRGQLEAAFADPDARAVFCVRGGYGTLRLLPGLTPSQWPNKAFVGFSDVTALHAALSRAARVAFHGPVLTQLPRLPESDVARLFQVLEQRGPAPRLGGARPLVAGVAEGPLLGGNLAVLSRLVGTPYLPELDGAVLLLEDIHERPYQLDRMWTHLHLAGVFERVAGIALGQFVDCEEKDATFTSGQVLEDLAVRTGKPCALGFPVGHAERNATVPLGVRVRLDAAAGTLDFLESALG